MTLRRVCRSGLVAAVTSAIVLTASPLASAASVACGDTISVDTTLESDLLGCAQGLIVSNAATLELAGHTIGGSGPAGVTVIGGGTVRGGTIRGFGLGILLEGGGVVERMRIVENQIGVLATFGGTGSLGYSIRNSAITRNSIGVSLTSGRGDVTSNQITLNSGDGIQIGGGAVTTVADNFILRNGGRGAYVSSSTTRFTGNVASNNGRDGIFVIDVYGLFFPYWFADNVADGNGGYGIAFFGVPTDPNSSPGTVDGGGNAAKHNASTPQCVNVVCSKH
jgi:hypothetical protein